MLDTNSVIKNSPCITNEILPFINFHNKLIFDVSYSHLLIAVYFIDCIGGHAVL